MPLTGVQLSEASPSASLTKYESLCVLYRTRSQEVLSAQRGKKSKTGVYGNASGTYSIAEELNCLINAATRAFICYCKPITTFYENDSLSKTVIHSIITDIMEADNYIIKDDEERCSTSTGNNCPRCTVSPSPVCCCSLCTPRPSTLCSPPAYGPTAQQAQGRTFLSS